MKNKNDYLLKNTLIFFVSAFATKLITFFLLPLYTAVLSTEEYGTADMISTTAALLVYIFTLNIGDAVLRFVIEFKENSRPVFYFGVNITMAGCVLCGLGIFSFYLIRPFNVPHYFYPFLFLGVVTSSTNILVANYARGINHVKQVGIAGVISTIVAVLSNLYLLLFVKMGVMGYLIAGTLASMTSSLYLIITNRTSVSNLDKKVRISRNNQKQMLIYSIPLIFNGIAWWINSAFDRYSIVYLRGVDQNGLYSAASKIPQILAIINSVFAQAWSLSAIRDVEIDDNDGFFSETYNAYNCVLVVTGGLIISLNIPLAHILFSSEFYEAWRFAPILVISTVFNALASFLGGAFTKAMRTGIYAKTTIFSTLVNILLNIIFINTFGTIGAAIATAASFFVLWIIRLIASRKYVTINAKIVKHFVSYAVLIAQVITEHLKMQFSVLQIAFMIILVILYYKEIRKIGLFVIKKTIGIIHTH